MIEILVSCIEILIAAGLIWFAIDQYNRIPGAKKYIILRAIGVVLLFTLSLIIVAGAIAAILYELA